MSPALFACDAVLFDMDGTLVDSRRIVERTWLRWAARHGVDPGAILAVAHGRRTLETMQLVAPHLASPEAAASLDAEEALDGDGGEVAVPGAIALTAALPRDRWAVVTSAVRGIALERMAGVGLPEPVALIGAEDVTASKPDPEGYLRAASLLGVTAGRCVVIEDAPPGVEAGRAAGARVIGVRTTYPALDGCDLVVTDLQAIEVQRAPDGSLRLVVHGGTSSRSASGPERERRPAS